MMYHLKFSLTAAATASVASAGAAASVSGAVGWTGSRFSLFNSSAIRLCLLRALEIGNYYFMREEKILSMPVPSTRSTNSKNAAKRKTVTITTIVSDCTSTHDVRAEMRKVV